MLDILIGNGDAHNPEDPRIKVYADTAQATFPGTIDTIDYFGYRGHALLGLVPVEEKYPYGSESCSRVPDFYYVAQQERSVYKNSETYFAFAEAALFGLKGSASDAQMYYEQGIQAGMEWAMDYFSSAESQTPEVSLLLHKRDKAADGSPAPWTEDDVQNYLDYKRITQQEVDDFMSNASVVTLTGTDEQKLEMIINQKVVALYPDEFQGWFEYRRTGYPRILVGHDNDDLKGKMPRRYPWPTAEEQVNSASFAAALERFGGVDDETVKVWWDANPDPIKPYPGEVLSMSQAWISAK